MRSELILMLPFAQRNYLRATLFNRLNERFIEVMVDMPLSNNRKIHS